MCAPGERLCGVLKFVPPREPLVDCDRQACSADRLWFMGAAAGALKAVRVSCGC